MTLLNPWVILGIVGALLVSFTSGGVLGWHEKSIRVPAELMAQQDLDTKACTKAQQLTKDANDALQKSHDVIAAKLKSLKLQHPSTCVHPASSSRVSGSGPVNAGQDGSGTPGINTDWLRGYAAECENYRAEVTECSTFLKQERAQQN